MNVELQVITKELDMHHIECMKELIEEQNPFTFLKEEDASERAIRTWIKTQASHNRMHQSTCVYWIQVDVCIVGIATIKKQLSEQLFADSGHIGLCIAPSHRRLGYGERTLQCLIIEAKQRYALRDVLLCCHYNNIASRLLCEKIGGIKKHEDSFVHYWISEHIEDVWDV